MGDFSLAVVTFLGSVPEPLQLFILALSSFAEGLPVIGSVLPGGTIAIFAGTLVEQGILHPLSTSIIIGLSSFSGDMTGFFVGKKFKHLKWIRKIVDNEKHQKTWDLFDRHIAIISIFGKLIPVVRSTPSIFAAIRGIKTRKYIIYSFIGSALWAFAGVYAGKLFKAYFGEKTIPFLFGLIILSITVVVFRTIIKNLYQKYKIRNSK